jgi:hypothetical protein
MNAASFTELTSGNSVAFAASYDVERGEALIADIDKSELQRMMDRKEAFSRPGHTVFLMNVDDFEMLIEASKSGRIKCRRSFLPRICWDFPSNLSFRACRIANSTRSNQKRDTANWRPPSHGLGEGFMPLRIGAS